jgi:hypothetical protein
VQGSPPKGYLEIERALRLLELGESDLWIAGKLHGVDHPAASEAAMLLRLAGAANGNGLGWFCSTSR